MKALHFKLHGLWNLSLAAMLLLLISFAATSCNKRDAQPGAESTGLSSLSSLLDGEIFLGNVETAQEEDGVVFSCNNGKDLLILEKTSFAPISISGNMQHAEILYSRFGIIVKDMDANKVWIYVNNDPESKEKFETARLYLQGNPSYATVFGNMKIRISLT